MRGGSYQVEADSFAHAAESRRSAGVGLSSRMLAETELPLSTVRQLRPHAARRGTTVPLVALEIVEAAVDLGCVQDLVADRAMPEPCQPVAARFAVGMVVGTQLRNTMRDRGARAEVLARAVIAGALDQGRVDRLLAGRFYRGDASSKPRAPAQSQPALPPTAATPSLLAPAPEPDHVAAALARWAGQSQEAAAALAPPRWRVVLAEVATAHSVAIDDIVGPSRKAKLMRPRFEAAYRLWRELDLSLPEVGRRLGGRDHSTVLHAIRHHAARLGLPLEQIKAGAGTTAAAIEKLDREAGAPPSIEPTHAPTHAPSRVDGPPSAPITPHRPAPAPSIVRSADMSMRAISIADFAGSEVATSFGPAPQLQWIKVVDLVVDDAYQRPLDTPTSRASVKAIAARFDWRYFAPVVVSPVPGGLYAIVDGQHRTTAAALCGHETVPCSVVLADRREQAEAFKVINGQVTRISGTQIFKAQLAAGDAEAAKIQGCAERAGVRILFSHQQAKKIKAHETYALGAIRRMLQLHGEEVVWRGLRAIRMSAGDVQGYLVAGIVTPVLQCLGENPAWVRHPGLDGALAHLDLREEHDKARAQAIQTRGQTAAINLQLRVTEHLEQSFARTSKVAA